MGWDVYCCICGNSAKGTTIDYLYEFFEEQTKENTIEIKNIVKKTKWCTKGMTLYTNDKNKKDSIRECCENHLPFTDLEFDNGIFVHTDCHKFVKITYGIDLHYSNLPINYKDINKKAPLGTPPLMGIDYDKIKKYWSQDFDYYKMSLDKNTYMLDSPLISSNVKNISRIKNIISQLKLKKELRPSPPISATFYKNNTIKIGNNNNFWIIKNNKWNEIKENIVKKKYTFPLKSKLIYKIVNIPQKAEYNNIPFFIYNIKETNKDYNIEFIGTDSSIDNFEKIYKIK